MMFFHFLKIIFNISTSKRFKKYKPHLILTKKKILIWSKTGSIAEPNKLLAYYDNAEVCRYKKMVWQNYCSILFVVHIEL
jgi:hypothetical protein